MTLLKRYTSLLAVLTVLLFFTGLPTYGFLMANTNIPPLAFITALIVATIPLLFVSGTSSEKRTVPALVVWCFGFLLAALIWYLPSSQSDVAWSEVRARLLSVAFLLTTYVLFRNAQVQLWARWAMVGAVLLVVANNVYELLNPSAFVPFGHDFSNVGRSAGFFINANQAGEVLVIGMIFTIGLWPERFRFPYAALVGVGTLLTLSRSAILGWAVIMVIAALMRVLPFKQLTLWFAGFVALLAGAIPGMNQLLGFVIERASINENMLARLTWFINFTTNDESSMERLQVAQMAWDLFANSPLVGNGIASTLEWSARASTHNTYLYFMADHGILGALFLPALVLATMWPLRPSLRFQSLSFGFFTLFVGAFSHNITSEYFFVVAFGLMAAMSRHSDEAVTTEPHPVGEALPVPTA